VLDQAPKDEIDDAAPTPPLSEDHGVTDNHPRTGPSSPPPAEEPVPLQQSSCLRKVPTHSGNVYGDGRHPIEVEKDIEWTRTWKDMVGKPGSSYTKPVTSSVPPGGFSDGPESEDLQCHCQFPHLLGALVGRSGHTCGERRCHCGEL
jgi:hypothetical protein